MKDKKQIIFEKQLKKIEKQLKVVTGIKTRHKHLKRHRELKNELKNKRKYNRGMCSASKEP
jgi:hypothetical protein